MVGQFEAVAKVLRGDLDCRLANRVGDLGNRVGVRLDHYNSRARPCATELERESLRRDSSADDGDIVIRVGAVILHQARFDFARQRGPCLWAQL